MEINIEQERMKFESYYIDRLGLRMEDYCLGYDAGRMRYADDCEQSCWEGWLAAKRAAMGSAEPVRDGADMGDLILALQDWKVISGKAGAAAYDKLLGVMASMLKTNGIAPSAPVSAEPVKGHIMGKWFEAKTVEEMQAFYMSRLSEIKSAAREVGYAIAVHGSTRRDFDLMAMAWREGAADKDALAHAVAMATCGIDREGPYQWEEKPLGRSATSIPVCWTTWQDMIGAGHIDLSVVEVPAAVGFTNHLARAEGIVAGWPGWKQGYKLTKDYSLPSAYVPTEEFLTAPPSADAKDGEKYRWIRDHVCNSLYLTRDGDHSCNYVSAKKWIEEYSPENFWDDNPIEVQKMKETNTIWSLQVYPNTPVGFNLWNASSLDAVIDAAIAAMENK